MVLTCESLIHTEIIHWQRLPPFVLACLAPAGIASRVDPTLASIFNRPSGSKFRKVVGWDVLDPVLLTLSL